MPFKFLLKMKKIGITGGIGSGKSVVCKIFNNLKVPVYNSDEIAKKILNSDEKIISTLKNNFGDNIYLDSNVLDKKKLSEIIFNDKLSLKKVNEIVHPVIKKHFQNWLKKRKKENHKYIIKEAAILFESGTFRELDKIITVFSPENIRIKRLEIRDKVDVNTIRKKISNQISEEEKIKMSDFVIYNDDKNLLVPQVLKIHKLLKRKI